MTRVVHLRHEPYDVRIDRLSKWGNPFRIPQDGDRDEVIAKFRDYISANPELQAAARRELRGKTLACWCSPKACHGDVLVALADEISA